MPSQSSQILPPGDNPLFVGSRLPAHHPGFGDAASEHPVGRARYLRRVAVKKGRRIVFLKIDEIAVIRAAGNYVSLESGAEKHLLRSTMSSFEKKLDPRQFVRIHRSTILNSERIREIETTTAGDYVAVLEDGMRLNWSRSYRDRLMGLLEQQT